MERKQRGKGPKKELRKESKDREKPGRKTSPPGFDFVSFNDDGPFAGKSSDQEMRDMIDLGMRIRGTKI